MLPEELVEVNWTHGVNFLITLFILQNATFCWQLTLSDIRELAVEMYCLTEAITTLSTCPLYSMTTSNKDTKFLWIFPTIVPPPGLAWGEEETSLLVQLPAVCVEASEHAAVFAQNQNSLNDVFEMCKTLFFWCFWTGVFCRWSIGGLLINWMLVCAC